MGCGEMSVARRCEFPIAFDDVASRPIVGWAKAERLDSGGNVLVCVNRG